MYSQSRSGSPRRSKSKDRDAIQDRHKLFVTSLDGSINENEIKQQLTSLFEKYGKINTITVRKNKNNEYHFAFVEYEPGFDAQKVIENLNKYEFHGKEMKVEFQDNNKRRKDPERGCYTCGRKGHFARECRSSRPNGSSYRGGRGRSRSRSRSRDQDRKRRHRSRSQSSERDRSRHKKRKEKKDRSRDRDEKKKKRHKKHRGSSSDSRS